MGPSGWPNGRITSAVTTTTATQAVSRRPVLRSATKRIGKDEIEVLLDRQAPVDAELRLVRGRREVVVDSPEERDDFLQPLARRPELLGEVVDEDAMRDRRAQRRGEDAEEPAGVERPPRTWIRRSRRRRGVGGALPPLPAPAARTRHPARTDSSRGAHRADLGEPTTSVSPVAPRGLRGRAGRPPAVRPPRRRAPSTRASRRAPPPRAGTCRRA